MGEGLNKTSISEAAAEGMAPMSGVVISAWFVAQSRNDLEDLLFKQTLLSEVSGSSSYCLCFDAFRSGKITLLQGSHHCLDVSRCEKVLP